MSNALLTREILSCTRNDLSTLIRVHDGRPTVTFLDTDGHEIGSWWPVAGTVLWHTFDGDQPMARTASTADEAAEILRPLGEPVQQPVDLALCMGLTKALGQCQRKPMTSAGANVHFCHAHQAQAPQPKAPKAKKAKKTSVQATARTATPKKESTMSTTPRLSLASTNARIDEIEGRIDARFDRLEALMTGKAPAKAPAKAKAAPKATRKAPAKKAAPKVVAAPKPATKGSRPVAGGSGLSRSAWNKTVTAKARLAGKGKGGKSVISLVTSEAGWAKVQAMRAEGMTPDQVLATFAK